MSWVDKKLGVASVDLTCMDTRGKNMAFEILLKTDEAKRMAKRNLCEEREPRREWKALWLAHRHLDGTDGGCQRENE
jgi:hypothetical protein